MARHGRVDDALEVYRRLKKGEEARVVPECATYTCVVSALCGLGRWSEAEDVFYEGLKRRKVSDLGTVRQLVRGLMHAGKSRGVWLLVCVRSSPDQFDGP
jgi:pentatricopeptide repeat protein